MQDSHGLSVESQVDDPSVRRAYVWGRFKVPKSKASKAPVPIHPLLAGFLLAWRDKTPFRKDTDLVFPSVRLKGKKPLSAFIMGSIT